MFLSRTAFHLSTATVANENTSAKYNIKYDTLAASHT